jgi:hypothetical protein
MLAILDGKSLEPALPDVTAPPVPAPISPHVSREQPLHPLAQITIAKRPEDEVEMIGQKTIGQNPHRPQLTGIAHGGQKVVEIFLGVKHLVLVVTSIKYMITDSTH